ncbi:hypothetical protein Ciccas_007291 [Cichlidogyrus casuarinus]|uniref:Uncharacterized protein n=1 Tax=Cichlidogyrus casuarinus TaxID=1844966 RepID=A0ABD2Q4M4_9PLAT
MDYTTRPGNNGVDLVLNVSTVRMRQEYFNRFLQHSRRYHTRINQLMQTMFGQDAATESTPPGDSQSPERNQQTSEAPPTEPARPTTRTPPMSLDDLANLCESYRLTSATTNEFLLQMEVMLRAESSRQVIAHPHRPSTEATDAPPPEDSNSPPTLSEEQVQHLRQLDNIRCISRLAHLNAHMLHMLSDFSVVTLRNRRQLPEEQTPSSSRATEETETLPSDAIIAGNYPRKSLSANHSDTLIHARLNFETGDQVPSAEPVPPEPVATTVQPPPTSQTNTAPIQSTAGTTNNDDGLANRLADGLVQVLRPAITGFPGMIGQASVFPLVTFSANQTTPVGWRDTVHPADTIIIPPTMAQYMPRQVLRFHDPFLNCRCENWHPRMRRFVPSAGSTPRPTQTTRASSEAAAPETAANANTTTGSSTDPIQAQFAIDPMTGTGIGAIQFTPQDLLNGSVPGGQEIAGMFADFIRTDGSVPVAPDFLPVPTDLLRNLVSSTLSNLNLVANHTQAAEPTPPVTMECQAQSDEDVYLDAEEHPMEEGSGENKEPEEPMPSWIPKPELVLGPDEMALEPNPDAIFVMNNSPASSSSPGSQGAEVWHTSVPSSWISVIERDNRQPRPTGGMQRPSDAYIVGMSAKRRKILADEKAELGLTEPTIEKVASSCIAEASNSSQDVLQGLEMGVGDDLRDAMSGFVHQSISQRVSHDPDYNPTRFPNIQGFLRQDKQQSD